MKRLFYICFLPILSLAGCKAPLQSTANADACNFDAPPPVFASEDRTIEFSNASDGYRAVLQFDPPRGFITRGGLNPEESIEISAHGYQRWMITDGPGNCLEMFEGPMTSGEYSITVANQDFEPE